ncbi:MAG: transcription termination factor Rho [Planctomycetota bacterium]|nr:MAG: transcription termination factor Rho [Planctomycetota bacterium]
MNDSLGPSKPNRRRRRRRRRPPGLPVSAGKSDGEERTVSSEGGVKKPPAADQDSARRTDAPIDGSGKAEASGTGSGKEGGQESGGETEARETVSRPAGGRDRRRYSRSARRERSFRGRQEYRPASQAPAVEDGAGSEVQGIFALRKDGTGFLRQAKNNLEARPSDPIVPQALVRRFHLKEGSRIVAKAFLRSKAPQVRHIETVDGLNMADHRKRLGFKKLTVIDPDFQYELGTHPQDGQISMRILDLLCPLGRGQRALLVAPPRSGKTTILQQVARAMEALFPDVHLIVLLVDERPEEATYWRRAVKYGEVFASTLDRSPREHTRLSEMVLAHASRMVEAGHEVMILLDSITRMARAYNNVIGSSGKTMSGGLDSRTMSAPKHFFGAARNTENAGSLTIIGTCLVETGSRMDQVIFEEFKGTGNMELVLDRKLADRRIFPAIATDRTGTRKEELLFSRPTMKKINILRRVLSRMKPFEAMELLIDRLQRFPSNHDFLQAFSLEDVE